MREEGGKKTKYLLHRRRIDSSHLGFDEVDDFFESRRIVLTKLLSGSFRSARTSEVDGE